MHPAPTESDDLLAVVHRLIQLARARGVPVSVDQTSGLVQALAASDRTSRSALRRAVHLTLAGEAAHLTVLDRVLDQVLPTLRREGRGPATSPPRDDLLAALTAGDPAAAALVAVDAADLVPLDDASMTATRGAQRVLRALDLADLMRRAAAANPGAEAARARQESLDAFERALLEELRHRAASSSWSTEGPTERETDPLDVDLLHLSAAELEALRPLVRPLARKLAARARRRHRLATRGRLDVPRTLRRALGTGGVPLDPALRRKRVSRPRVIVLADVSGSMADHSRFLLALLQAMLDELPGLRTFVFVDGVGDVTGLLAGSQDVLDTRALLTAPGVVADDGHSDYAAALQAFSTRFPDAVDGRTTLVVLGDARVRGLDPGTEVLAELARRARSVQWLNPERRGLWDTGDSRAAEYADHCRGMFEVRTLRQLGAWVESLVS